MSSTLPSDLIPDILYRLPVKSLLRFRCLAKTWGSLIDDPDFAKLHLHQSLKANTNVKLLLDNSIEEDDKAYSVDFDSFGNLAQIPRPFQAEITSYYSRIFGSCNGLLAVYHRDAGIALWNPSTRKHHYLPPIPDDITTDHDYQHGFDYDPNTILGFGYDVLGNDYKVVKMLRSKTNNNTFIVMVYGLKSNCWRRIKDCPYDIPYNYSDGAYTNGSLHWVGDEKGDDDNMGGGKLIFGLHLGTEDYHLLPGADIDFSNFGYKNVGVLGGCLCVFHDWLTGGVEDHVVLWLMKEYGVKESWTELFYLFRDYWLTNIFHSRAIAYSRNGDKILVDDGGCCQPAWFNVEDETGESLSIPGAPPRFSATIFVESLVSLNY